MTVIVTTVITITETVPETFEAQVKRNFERDPYLDGGDDTIRKHIKKLMPVLDDENIAVEFEMMVIE